MDKKTKALMLALEALDCIYSPLHVREINKVGAAMSAIREALAEQPAQQQEPDFWYAKVNGVHELISPFKPDEDTYDEGTLVELYKSPPASNSLSDELLTALRKCSEQLSRLGYSSNPEDPAIAKATWVIHD